MGYKHRSGALRDNTAYRLVAGAFDIDAARGREFGVNLGVPAERCYDNYQQLLAQEANREDGVEVVTIATPTAPIMKSRAQRWMPACMSSVKSRCSSPRRRREKSRRWQRRKA